MSKKLWIVLAVLVVGSLTTFIALTSTHKMAPVPAASAKPSGTPSEGRIAVVSPSPSSTPTVAPSGTGGGGGSTASGTQVAPRVASSGSSVSTQQGGFSGGESGFSNDDSAQAQNDRCETRRDRCEESNSENDRDRDCPTC